MHQKFLQLNTDKTEVIVVCPKEEKLKITAHLNTVTLKMATQARNLWTLI